MQQSNHQDASNGAFEAPNLSRRVPMVVDWNVRRRGSPKPSKLLQPPRSQTPSAATASLPSGVAMAYQGCQLTLVLMKRTDPSMKLTLTPPGCMELAFCKVIVARQSTFWSAYSQQTRLG